MIKNALTIDLEDWFCAYNISSLISQEKWPDCEMRLPIGLQHILSLLRQRGVHATFFVLGWVAERVPDLILEIEADGHEIAVHGYRHLLLTKITPRQFEEDLALTLDLLRKVGVKYDIVGFRAPSFTITRTTLWALDILERYGFKYDSSVFPIGFHPDYGVPDAPLTPYRITPGIMECPMSSLELFGKRVPFGGGGYFRVYPYLYTKLCFRACNSAGRSGVFYIHPWEFDPDQPKLPLPYLKRFRHYYGLGSTKEKFERLLNDFSFTTIREILSI